jgi:hypothetical protein
LNIYKSHILFIISNNRFNYAFPALSLSKYYIIFDIYSIDNLLFWGYKYGFELLGKELNINSSSNHDMLGSNIPMSDSNYNFYLIKKNNITIYKQNLFALLDHIIIIFRVLDIFMIRNNPSSSKYYIVWIGVWTRSSSSLSIYIEFVVVIANLSEYEIIFIILIIDDIIKIL